MKTKNLRKLFDYDYVKDKLFVKVYPKNGNEYLLINVPHREIEDLVLFPYVLLDKSPTGEIVSAVISNDMLKAYDLDENVLIDLALLNSIGLFPAVVEDINTIMARLIGIPANELDTPEDVPEQIVVTNNENAFGASALFYPEVMEELARRHKGNYFILPSSIHEIITVPDDGKITYEELKEMVTEINHAQVSPEERLTDEVYYYDVAKREFRKGEAK